MTPNPNRNPKGTVLPDDSENVDIHAMVIGSSFSHAVTSILGFADTTDIKK